MNDLMIKIDHVSKQYKLGQIGGTTLRDELQRKRAKILNKEDPTKRIGAKDYVAGETFMALDDISFEVKKGERVGIIGHNGAGKSTLLKLISRVTAPTKGMIGLNGRITSMLEVGTGFHGELTGRENIYMNGAILGMTKKEIDAKIEDIIDFSEVRQFIDTPVKRYSSGMYVKLAFSVAAHLDSEIMIMDEVLAVGDMAFQKKCLDKMNDVSKTQGRTILYVSHNMNTIRQLCERVIVLDHGNVVYDGDVEEGIDTYLNVAANDVLEIDYSNEPTMEWLINPRIRILKASYFENKSTNYISGDKIRVNISWISLYENQELFLRIEVHRLDGSAVASGFSCVFQSGNQGEERDLVFEIDTTTLIPGKYNMIYSFISVDNMGNEGIADCRYGLFFSIVDEKLNWNQACWGNTKLPKISIIDF